MSTTIHALIVDISFVNILCVYDCDDDDDEYSQPASYSRICNF